MGADTPFNPLKNDEVRERKSSQNQFGKENQIHSSIQIRDKNSDIWFRNGKRCFLTMKKSKGEKKVKCKTFFFVDILWFIFLDIIKMIIKSNMF